MNRVIRDHTAALLELMLKKGINTTNFADPSIKTSSLAVLPLLTPNR
jgi:hypothetical protein